MSKNERLLYQANNFSPALAFFFLFINTWQVIFTLNMIDVSAEGIRVMEIILLNILLSFLVFIVASEVKRYSLIWSWAGLGIGVFQCLRALFIPAGTRWIRINIAVSLEFSGFILIFASIWSLAKCAKYRQAERESQ
ncbi:MAG: hypothetical protein FWH38_08350 [Treponema sp.]|nr:hypothetical protein [Treponema sp.]